MEFDIARALLRCYPDAEWHLYDGDYSTIDWLSETPKPSLKRLKEDYDKALLEDAAAAQAEADAKAAARASLVAKLEALKFTPAEIEALTNGA